MGSSRKKSGTNHPIEKIVDRRDGPEGIEYLVRWEGAFVDSWQPMRNLERAWRAVADYEEDRGRARNALKGGGGCPCGGAGWIAARVPVGQSAHVAHLWEQWVRLLGNLDEALLLVRYPTNNMDSDLFAVAANGVPDFRHLLQEARIDILAIAGVAWREVEVRLNEVEHMLLWAANDGPGPRFDVVLGEPAVEEAELIAVEVVEEPFRREDAREDGGSECPPPPPKRVQKDRGQSSAGPSGPAEGGREVLARGGGQSDSVALVGDGAGGGVRSVGGGMSGGSDSEDYPPGFPRLKRGGSHEREMGTGTSAGGDEVVGSGGTGGGEAEALGQSTKSPMKGDVYCKQN